MLQAIRNPAMRGLNEKKSLWKAQSAFRQLVSSEGAAATLWLKSDEGIPTGRHPRWAAPCLCCQTSYKSSPNAQREPRLWQAGHQGTQAGSVLGLPVFCLEKPLIVWDNLRKTLIVWDNCAGSGFGDRLLLVSTSQKINVILLQAASAEKNLWGQVGVHR